MLPSVIQLVDRLLDIYRSSKQNIFIDFNIWVCLQCKNKNMDSIDLVLGCVVLLYLAVGLCASDGGYSFLFVTDEQFSKCRDNRANTKPLLHCDPLLKHAKKQKRNN